jgi:hypothetical protein
MTELFRTRDCVVFHRSDAYPVAITPTAQVGGWPGGQGFQWQDSLQDEFLTTYSDGSFGGFALWGSDESSDQYISLVGNQVRYGAVILCIGSWLIATTTFERYTYASRIGGGPLVPLVYVEGSKLRFSLRGFWTVEDEWTLSADPRAPNTNYTGLVVQAPTVITDNYLTLQTIL